MNRILITESIQTRQQFFDALGRTRACARPAPRNLDDLADFLREGRIGVIIAADMHMELSDFAAIGQVLQDLGINLVR